MRLALYPVGGYWFVAVVAAVMLLLLLIGPGDRAQGRRRRTLAVLRVASFVMLALALLRPTLVRTITTRKPATLVLLVDLSRSMGVEDALGSKSRFAAMQDALAALAPDIKALGKEVDVRLYGFDEELRPIAWTGASPEWPDAPTGVQSAIGWSLDEILRRESGARVAGVIVLSDGSQRVLPDRDVAMQTPGRRLADLGYRLYAVPFGQDRGLDQARDVALQDLRTSDVVFVKNPLDAGAVARIEGFAGLDVPVQLLFETKPGEMEVVGASPVRAQTSGERVPLELSYTPQTAGEFKVTLRAAEQPGELVTANNELSTFVTVREGGLNVLYLNGALLPEQRHLRWALDASPDINVEYRYIDARRPETKPADLSELLKPGKFNVYVLGDLDAQAFSEEELALLRQSVERGAGLIMLGGLHSFGAGGYGKTPLADVLPITIDSTERQNFDEPVRSDLHLPDGLPVAMRPTGQGLRQRFMALAPGEQNAQTWAKLPPLAGANRFAGVKPQSSVLAETDRGEPLLVAKDFGLGRVLAFAGDSTWQWWMQGHEAAHKRFWRQVTLYLARKDQSEGSNVWLALDRRRYAPGTRVDFLCGVRTPEGDPIPDAVLSVEVVGPDGQRRPARLRNEQDATAGVFLEANAPGDYLVVVNGSQNGQPLGTAQARFLVYDQDLEMDNPAADRRALASLAALTGGRTVAPEQLADVLVEVREQLEDLEVDTQIKQPLWDTWWFFLLFIGILCTEWYLRKKWGMV